MNIKSGEKTMKDLVKYQLGQSVATMRAVEADDCIHDTIVEVAEITARSMQRGGKLLVAGNGGSAADAQHLVAEFVARLTVNRPALRAISLTTDTSILTAVGNDFTFECIFERQIEALGQTEDVFLAISTSGNSANLLRALRLAKQQGLITVGFTGQSGGQMAALCDHIIKVPSDITMNIQEAHLALEHIFCMLVERFTFGPNFDRQVQSAAE